LCCFKIVTQRQTKVIQIICILAKRVNIVEITAHETISGGGAATAAAMVSVVDVPS